MRARVLVFCGLGLSVAVGGFWVLQANQGRAGAGLIPYEDAASVAAGKEIYSENCASCHGKNLEGQPDWQGTDAEGFMPAPPHDETGHTWHHDDQLLYMITKFGTEQLVGGGYKSNMQGYDDTLSDAEILQTLAYIKSTWSPRLIEMHNSVNENADLGN